MKLPVNGLGDYQKTVFGLPSARFKIKMRLTGQALFLTGFSTLNQILDLAAFPAQFAADPGGIMHNHEKQWRPLRQPGRNLWHLAVFSSVFFFGLFGASILPGLQATAFALTSEASAGTGHVLAQQWCSHCHSVEKADALRLQPAVPTFVEIAGQKTITSDLLVAILKFPHPAMPDLNLSRREAADLAAYILSLKP